MKHSESVKNIAGALCSLQADLHNPKNTATNPFLKNKYAPLNDIITEVKPVLINYGLSIVQLPTGEGTVGVSTMILHESGEWIEDTVTMTVNPKKGLSDAQEAGSMITYLRRYALSAVLNIASEDDTDGNRPQSNGNGNGKKPEPKPEGPSPEWQALREEALNLLKDVAFEGHAFREEFKANHHKWDVKTFKAFINKVKAPISKGEPEQEPVQEDIF